MYTLAIAILSFFAPLVALAKQGRYEQMVWVCYVLITFAAYRACDTSQLDLFLPR